METIDPKAELFADGTDEGLAANLSDQQIRFVYEYLKDLNATKAAIRAGYSKKSANSLGPRMKTHPYIKKAIEEAMRQRSARNNLSPDWVILKLMTEATNHTKGSSHAARVQAIIQLGKHQGMFIDRVEQKTEITKTIVVNKQERGKPSLKAVSGGKK